MCAGTQLHIDQAVRLSSDGDSAGGPWHRAFYKLSNFSSFEAGAYTRPRFGST